LRPSKNKDDFDTQQTWYMSQARGWFDTGPCSGIKKNTPNAVYPDAQTLKEQLIIYFCPRVWDDIGTRLKDDVRNYKSATIATDGTQYLDSYMTPGATLLHEMTHQVFDSGMFRSTQTWILILIVFYQRMDRQRVLGISS
jgi:hypothetical protein